MVKVFQDMYHSFDLEALSRGAERALPEDESKRSLLRDGLERTNQTLPAWAPLCMKTLGEIVRPHLSSDDLLDVIANWHLDELVIAHLAMHGDTNAIGIVSAMITNTAPALLSRGFEPNEIEEVSQEQLTALLVGTRPKLTLYSGRGSLAGFLRSAMIRSTLNRRRNETTRLRYAFAQRLEEVLDEPELQHLKQNYLARFREALKSAMASLDAEKKLALRLQLEDGLSIDDLGRMWGVHRATAARRLVTARETLATETRRQLQEDLDLSQSELTSIMHLIRSRLGDVTSVLS